MEKANGNLDVQKSRYIAVVPAQLKEIALKMEFAAEQSDRSKEKIAYKLTDDVVLFYDPEHLNVLRREDK